MKNEKAPDDHPRKPRKPVLGVYGGRRPGLFCFCREVYGVYGGRRQGIFVFLSGAEKRPAMSWLARLKTGKHPDTHATKPTKPTTDPQNRGFVGFVASLPECFQKTAVSTDAANDPTPEPRKPESERRMVTLAHDPGAPRLLAMAMAFCDRTGASDKERTQWQQDAADTPPELRGDLYQHLREQLPPAPPAPPKPHPAPAPKPMGWLHMEQPWRAADRLYQSHHWQCAACMASARAAPGTTSRCTEGQRLHDEYTSEGHRP